MFQFDGLWSILNKKNHQKVIILIYLLISEKPLLIHFCSLEQHDFGGKLIPYRHIDLIMSFQRPKTNIIIHIYDV